MTMKVNGTSGLTFPDTTTLASAGQASVRAWVNFNGTGTVAIRASYNVTSITDNGTGDYTLNFTTAMPDANYSVVGMSGEASGATARLTVGWAQAPTTTTYRLLTFLWSGGAAVDPTYVNVAVFR